MHIILRRKVHLSISINEGVLWVGNDDDHVYTQFFFPLMNTQVTSNV